MTRELTHTKFDPPDFLLQISTINAFICTYINNLSGSLFQPARRIAIIEESPTFMTRNVESSKNILLKIVNSQLIAKLDGAADFHPRRCKIVTIILTILIRSSRRAICSTIHVVVDGWWVDGRDVLMRGCASQILCAPIPACWSASFLSVIRISCSLRRR